MEVFENFIYFGGGGGMEVENLIQGYRLPPRGHQFITDKPVYEEDTGDNVPNFMTLARDVGNISMVYVFPTGHKCDGCVSDIRYSPLQNRQDRKA